MLESVHIKLTLILSLVLSVISLEQSNVSELCLTDSDCGSSFLYCTDDIECLCETSKANFFYEFGYDHDIQQADCEVKKCDSAIEPKNRGDQCLLYDDMCPFGICKCSLSIIRARQSDPDTKFTSYCKEFAKSSVGGSCSSTAPICDVSKKLECRGVECECIINHIFSYEDDICISKEEYVEKYGSNSIGQLGQYCSSSIECQSEMLCENKKCDCPLFCSSELVRTDELCYCPKSYINKMVVSIICVILIFIVFGIISYALMKVQDRYRSNTDPDVIRLENTNSGESSYYVKVSEDALSSSPHHKYPAVAVPSGSSGPRNAPPATYVNRDRPPSYKTASTP